MLTVTGFEQFAVGQVFTSAARSIDATAIKAFAAQFDFQPQHMDEAAAEPPCSAASPRAAGTPPPSRCG